MAKILSEQVTIRFSKIVPSKVSDENTEAVLTEEILETLSAALDELFSNGKVVAELEEGQ